jgi:uncharacterized protein (DUF3084 family)
MLKNLKSLFIVTEEEPKSEENLTQNTSESSKQPIDNKQVVNNNSTPTLNNPVVDENILNKLLQAFENNNQPGFDYMEFRQSLKAMSHLPLDESTKFQTAFATASAIGATQDNLIASINFYKKVLQNEEDSFKKASTDQSIQNIDAKKNELTTFQKNIEEKSAMIQKLTQEIMEHQKKMESINTYIVEAETKISETQNKFKNTVNFIYKQLEDDATKLKTYIK